MQGMMRSPELAIYDTISCVSSAAGGALSREDWESCLSLVLSDSEQCSQDKRSLNLTCATDGRRPAERGDGGKHYFPPAGGGIIIRASPFENAPRSAKSAPSLLDNGGNKFHNLLTVTGG